MDASGEATVFYDYYHNLDSKHLKRSRHVHRAPLYRMDLKPLSGHGTDDPISYGYENMTSEHGIEYIDFSLVSLCTYMYL